MEQYSYQQTALTFTVQYHPKNHHRHDTNNTIPSTSSSSSSLRRCAYQRYLSNGSVLALLPTYDIDNYGIIVYSTSAEEAKYWKEHAFSQSNDITNNNTGSQDLVDYLNQMLQTGPERLPSILSPNNNDSTTTLMGRMATNVLYGIEQMANTIQYGMSMAAQQPTMKNNDVEPSIFHAPPIIERIVSLPYTYPLMCQLPKKQQYTIHNYLALVGDAAHTVHPMAGQGLNLGLQDVMALRDVIMKAKNSGMDVGTYLQEYNTSRQIQVSTTVAAIHGLQQLLCHRQSNGIIGKHMKAFGMNFIQNVKSVRQKIVRAACYGV